MDKRCEQPTRALENSTGRSKPLKLGVPLLAPLPFSPSLSLSLSRTSFLSLALLFCLGCSMGVSIYQSPTKRPRIPDATASPVSSTKDKALQMKRSDRFHVQPRYISSEAISDIDASREAPQGFQVYVAPQLSGTNKYIEDLVGKQERFDKMELYVLALHSSVSLCVADLTMVPMYLLDYHMRRLFLEKKQKAADPKRYQALFVGKGRKKPFKGTSGDQIRYCYLLRCYHRLVGDDDDDDTDGEEKDVEYVNEQLECFKDLLQSSEDHLSVVLCYCGAMNVEAPKIRDEAWTFLESEEKEARDTGAHIFTQFFCQQRRTPLEKQHLQDKNFPPENDAIFPLTEPTTLARMGLKVLALTDIEKQLNAPDVSPFRLTPVAPTLVRAGVDIVKCFIKLKGNVTESIEFKYGTLSATLGESKPTVYIDLLALRR